LLHKLYFLMRGKGKRKKGEDGGERQDAQNEYGKIRLKE